MDNDTYIGTYILCKLYFVIIKYSVYCCLFFLSTLSDLFIKYNQHHCSHKCNFHNLRIHNTISKTILSYTIYLMCHHLVYDFKSYVFKFFNFFYCYHLLAYNMYHIPFKKLNGINKFL